MRIVSLPGKSLLEIPSSFKYQFRHKSEFLFARELPAILILGLHNFWSKLLSFQETKNVCFSQISTVSTVSKYFFLRFDKLFTRLPAMNFKYSFTQMKIHYQVTLLNGLIITKIWINDTLERISTSCAYSSAFSHYYSWKKWFQYYSGRIKSPPSLFQKDKMLKENKCSFSSGWMELDSIHMSLSEKENDSKPAIFLEITYKTNALNWQFFSIRFTRGTMLLFSTVFGIISRLFCRTFWQNLVFLALFCHFCSFLAVFGN